MWLRGRGRRERPGGSGSVLEHRCLFQFLPTSPDPALLMKSARFELYTTNRETLSDNPNSLKVKCISVSYNSANLTFIHHDFDSIKPNTRLTRSNRHAAAAVQKMARSFDELLEFLNDQVAIRGESGKSGCSCDAKMSEASQKRTHRDSDSNACFLFTLH